MSWTKTIILCGTTQIPSQRISSVPLRKFPLANIFIRIRLFQEEAVFPAFCPSFRSGTRANEEGTGAELTLMYVGRLVLFAGSEAPLPAPGVPDVVAMTTRRLSRSLESDLSTFYVDIKLARHFRCSRLLLLAHRDHRFRYPQSG